MTGDVNALASGGCHIFSGCGFPAPGLQDFEWKPFFSIGCACASSSAALIQPAR